MDSHCSQARLVPVVIALLFAGVLGVFALAQPSSSQAMVSNPGAAPVSNVYKLIGWNDLGIHWMNEDFTNLAMFPPTNTLRAQLVLQGARPRAITTGVTIEYSVFDNTYSACQNGRCKSNFWQYAAQLFPGSPSATQPNVGLTGRSLTGTMSPGSDYFVADGIPLTPYLDSAPSFTPSNWYPYHKAQLVARDSSTNQVLAQTVVVAPVSTEMRCDACHADGAVPGGHTGNVELNILTSHDSHFGTNLVAQRPVLCASCHASNALGLPGDPNRHNFSRAMHGRHAMEGINDCYLCHPGQQTQFFRDVMYTKGLTCVSCHGNTTAVANPNRVPWVDLPRCGDAQCHGTRFAENPGKRYRDSMAHGIYCEGCHGSPHAIVPTAQPNDNIQSIALQGVAGTLDCWVCHGNVPANPGVHGFYGTPDIPNYLPFIRKN